LESWPCALAGRPSPSIRKLMDPVRNCSSLLAALLLLGSLIVTAILAVRSGSDKPPSTLEAWFLAVVAAALQVSAGIRFASVGRADPALARSSVRYLATLGLRAQSEIARRSVIACRGKSGRHSNRRSIWSAAEGPLCDPLMSSYSLMPCPGKRKQYRMDR